MNVELFAANDHLGKKKNAVCACADQLSEWIENRARNGCAVEVVEFLAVDKQVFKRN